MAQNKGMFPLTGMRYINEGVWAKSIDIRIDGSYLLSNKVPFNREIELLLTTPSGFTADKKKICYAGCELTLTKPNGDVIITNPNLLLKNEATGFTPKDFKTLSMKFAITVEMVKTLTNVMLKFRVFDLKGKNQLRLEFPISLIVKSGEVFQISKTIKPLKAPANAMGTVSGVKANNMYVSTDTTIKVDPKMAYLSVDITGINGTSLGGIFDGKESFWVYDVNFNELKINDILLKQVGGAMENNVVDYTLKIPFRLKKAPPKGYYVRFRWESADHAQVIDFVVGLL